MIERPILDRHRRAAKMRVLLDSVAVALPLTLGAAAIGWRLGGGTVAIALSLIGAAVLALVAWRRGQRFDRAWLVSRLDAEVPAFEDSSALLFAPGAKLAGLAELQRRRIEARIDAAQPLDLRPPWSQRAILAAWIAAIVLALAAWLWPDPLNPIAPQPTATPAPVAGPPRLVAASIGITPPAYTGLPAREQASLDAQIPAGSRITWSLAFSPHPAAATIAFPGSQAVPLTRNGARWTAAHTATRPALYRIEATALPRQRLHRIETIADTPPTIRAITPSEQLATVTAGQRRWTPVFEASDDYGVAAGATLRITVTAGEGENISFTQRTIMLAGSGPSRRRRFTATLDIAREGLAPGGDLIAQLIVTDNRSPASQRVEGPSVILRWPTDLGLADGLNGMAQPVMPAYFRSQRQIIIDAEALIRDRARLGADAFATRSNALGEDQAILRLRYGQFVGEEAEGAGSGGGIALPTNDEPALPTNDTPPAAAQDRQDPTLGDGHSEGDGHDHGAPGGDFDAARSFGHVHDDSDASTLYDPGTRSTLAQALDAMWSSERELRQGDPRAALPHANRALALLKEAQQATRIFLPRVGAELPPIDLTRRLSGDREGIVARRLPQAEPPNPDTALSDAWRGLADIPGKRPPLRLGALDRWVRTNGDKLADPLALRAAIDTLRGEPGCGECRDRLRALLWRAIEPPPAAIKRRATPRPSGRRYLEALR
ncbi:DUF4175 family protein [Sphingomonas sp. 37zxx]|uniref:DUF4175 family protein n=1 Tax=Sphingomonas sp. 37zxx TaxID=1550073 RepID=UPI00053BF79C|nr:DUF4175 family protein [Sphingomonas sp. 37zxx]